MNNFYNSPALTQRLVLEHCVGTLRLNRKDVPKTVREKKLKKVEMIAQHSGLVSVLKWRDKNDVAMISTYHGEEAEKS
jgi:hypothetical protein